MWIVLAIALLATAARGGLVKFKTGVVLDLQPDMARALPLIEQAHVDAGISRGAFITSGTDGVHRDDSKHYLGLAVDLRTRDLTSGEVTRLTTALRRRLNGNGLLNRPYQVIVEGTHIHVEYDPN